MPRSTIILGLLLLLFSAKSISALPLLLSGSENWIKAWNGNDRLLPCLAVSALWCGWAWLARFLSGEGLRLPFPIIAAAAVGWGGLFTLLATRMGFALSSASTRLLLFFPFPILLYLLKRSRRQATASPPSLTPRWSLVACTALGSLVVFHLGSLFFWCVVEKTVAQADEAFFWWPSLDHILRRGFTAYLSEFLVSNYPPGFPFAANFLLFGFPTAAASHAAYAIPWLQGIALIAWLLPERSPRSSPHLWIASLLAVISLFFQHLWTQMLSFQFWYGEGMAILCIAALYFALELKSPIDRILRAALLVGLGAFAQISKPPLSNLLLPAFLPGLALIGTLTRPKDARKEYLIGVAYAAAGAIGSLVLWSSVLAFVGKKSYYSAGATELTIFHWSGVIGPLLKYFLTTFKTAWISFLLLSGWILMTKTKTYLASWITTVGLVFSVLLLYLTYWYDAEYESGGRYLLHGLYGWILFVWAKEKEAWS